MATAEKIAEYVRLLPERLQVEVLDFVSFLLSKGGKSGPDSDRSEWSHYSLESAMRGMEADDDPEYDADDLKETFS
ncbi:MAG: hypothetical protein WD423_00735 [Rhodothermales bacterium]